MSPTNVIRQIIDFIFDNLFILIIFASFILPLFRRNSKKAPAKPVQQRPATNQQSTQTTTQPVIVEADDDFAKRLEEARKRVQSAMGDNAQPQAKLPNTTQSAPLTPSYSVPKAAEQTSSSQSTLLPPQKTPSQTQLKQRSVNTSRSILGQDIRSEHPLMGADRSSSFLPAESVTSTSMLREEQAPLQVSKRKSAKKAKKKADRLLAFDEKSIARGFVWHYILSEPKSKEGRNHSRRKAFQHQS